MKYRIIKKDEKNLKEYKFEKEQFNINGKAYAKVKKFIALLTSYGLSYSIPKEFMDVIRNFKNESYNDSCTFDRMIEGLINSFYAMYIENNNEVKESKKECAKKTLNNIKDAYHNINGFNQCFIREISKKYFENNLSTLSKDEINKLFDEHLNANFSYEILENKNNDEVIEMINLIVNDAYNSAINNAFNLENQHLCFDCQNALKCPKVLSERNYSFPKYPFIQNGLITMKDGKVESYLVSKCAEFIKDKGRDTDMSKKEIKKAKDFIYQMQFDTGSVEEAFQKHMELQQRGQYTKQIRRK